MLRRAAVILTLTAGLVWTGWAFAVEIHRIWSPPAEAAAPLPHRWSFQTPEARELLAWLEEVDRTLPAGRVVAIAPRPLPGSEEFFLYLWAVYGLPRHDVVRAVHPWTWERAQYVVAYGLRYGDPAWETLLGRPAEEALPLDPEPVLEHPLGAVYRVGRP